jgi:hypothetical protein
MTTDVDARLRDQLREIYDAALLRVPKEQRTEFAEIVQRRVARLERPLTRDRLYSILGGARHALRGAGPR